MNQRHRNTSRCRRDGRGQRLNGGTAARQQHAGRAGVVEGPKTKKETCYPPPCLARFLRIAQNRHDSPQTNI